VLLARLAGIGWTVAAAIAAGAVGGWWLDGRLGTRPWLTLAGTVLGAAAAFTAMVRLLQAVSGGPKRKQGK
jgi:F0F1-type ATP synthase assembly protein I